MVKYEQGLDQRAGATSNTGLRLKVQGRDGKLHEFVVPPDRQEYYKNKILPRLVSSLDALRLTPPVTINRPAEEFSLGSAGAFFGFNRDASNLVLTWLSPDSWLELEGSCRAASTAVMNSMCWFSPGVMIGHSLRFRPDQRKVAYLRHRRAVERVAKAFQDLRRFARSPDSVFNPGATLSEIYSAEQRTGVVFPDEARASFTLFDGQARSTWLRAEGVIGGFKLLSLDQSVELMLEEACFRGALGKLEFVPLADRRNSNAWLVAAVDDGRVCVVKPLSRPKIVARSWSGHLRVQ